MSGPDEAADTGVGTGGGVVDREGATLGIVGFSIRRPVTVLVLAMAAVVFGLVAYRELAVNLLPDISYPSLTVRTQLAGTAPVEIESLLTEPVENAVGVVNNVVRVTSSSRADTSEVTLEFAWGTDMDFAALDVRERLDTVALPADAERPVLLRYDPQLDPIMRIALTGGSDLTRLRFTAEEDVRRALERLDGIAAVVVSGGLEEEIEVALDERRLAGLELTADAVATRLAAENVDLAGGSLRDGRTEYLVRTVNRALRARDLEDIVVAHANGAIVRLGDIAMVATGHKDRTVITRLDGAESVELAVYKEGGTNTVAVSDAVAARIEELRAELGRIDPDLELAIVTDQARYIRQAIREVLETAFYGGLLAVLVLVAFLRSAVKTAIVAIAIPVSVVATFFLMYVFDISLNIMSLGGLTLGIGLLVDNAIVVLEAIQRRIEQGADPVRAALEGTSEVGGAITASTLTTICVFVPIVFVEGVAAQLFRDQALTVAFALVVSLGVALTVIPMLASRRTAVADGAPAASTPVRITAWPLRLLGTLVALPLRLVMLPVRPLFGVFERGLASTMALYRRALDAVLLRPLVTIAVTLTLLAASLLLYPQLGTELIPELVQGEFTADLELPPGARLEVTDRQLRDLGDVAAELPGVSTVYAIAGSSRKQGGTAGTLRENLGQLTVTLEPPPSRAREDHAMDVLRAVVERENELAGGAPAARPPIAVAFARPSWFSFQTAIEVEIRGHHLELLTRLAEEAARRMRAIDGLADVTSSTEGGSPELVIHLDRERLARAGLTVSTVADRLRTLVQGDVPTTITRADRTVDIRVRAGERYRDAASDLATLTVAHVDGVALPLGALATIDAVEGPAEIRRADGSRVAGISANLAGRDLGSVADDITTALGAMTWPEGFDWALGGQEREMETSFSSLRLAIALAVFLVYLVMASQFESLLHPLVILFSVPFAVIGVLATMAVFEVTISVVSMIGFVLLAGIVVNNAIVLIDCTNQLRRAGASKLDALRQAGQIRLRPILMTTATTVLGLLPMAIGLGEGAELRTPMALTVIGGMVTSTVLTLLVVPAVYAVLDRGR